MTTRPGLRNGKHHRQRIAQLLARQADRGYFYRVGSDDRPVMMASPPVEDIDTEAHAQIMARSAEVVAWLRTPIDRLPPEDLRAMGFAPGLDISGLLDG